MAKKKTKKEILEQALDDLRMAVIEHDSVAFAKAQKKINDITSKWPKLLEGGC